ncbi:MAG: IS21 family transposase [Usitatibacter sp.]
MRQKLLLGRSHREIARSVGVSGGTVATASSRARGVGLDWSAIAALTDEALEERVYGPRGGGRSDRPMPDPAYLHVELRKTGVTLQLLHLEYLERHPNGYRYTKFCGVYAEWLARRGPSMRQTHEAGDKLFVDYSGKKPRIVDRRTGEVIEVELFVAVLGATNYTYAEATYTQRIADWIGAHVRAFAHFGGVTRLIVPDQLRTGVTAPCRYEPGLQRTYEELAQHYTTAILPARPGSPRDKAKVEAGVLVAQRWILARLRNQTFFSLAELNERIAALLVDLNDRRMRLYGASRRELFERLERATLRPLPAEPFEYGEWKEVRVNIDYHVEVDHHFYSVPHELIHEKLEARWTQTTVEILRGTERITSHARSHVRGKHTTKPEHMPASHQKHLEWSPSRIIRWGASVGASTAALLERILASRQHPEHGYRSCLGILRLSKKYGHERLERACGRALRVNALSYKHVESTLRHGLDHEHLDDEAKPARPGVVHENIRGRGYYH